MIPRELHQILLIWMTLGDHCSVRSESDDIGRLSFRDGSDIAERLSCQT
jgi:hypothetical protein